MDGRRRQCPSDSFPRNPSSTISSGGRLLSIATERESPVLLRQAHLGEHATKLFYFGGKLLEPSLFNQANFSLRQHHVPHAPRTNGPLMRGGKDTVRKHTSNEVGRPVISDERGATGCQQRAQG